MSVCVYVHVEECVYVWMGVYVFELRTEDKPWVFILLLMTFNQFFCLSKPVFPHQRDWGISAVSQVCTLLQT